MDYFSRRPEVAFTFKVDTSTVKHFLAMVFRREGNPKELVLDDGPQFTFA